MLAPLLYPCHPYLGAPRPTLTFYAQGEVMFKNFPSRATIKPVLMPLRAERGSAAQFFFPAAGWPKKCEVQKMLSSSIPPRPGGPPESLPRYRSAMEGGGPLRGWMKGLNIFWTLHFLSSQLLRSCPKGLSHLPQRGGATSKNVLVFGLCMCLSRNVKNLP